MTQLETARLLLTPFLAEDYLEYTTLLQEPAIHAFNPYLLSHPNEKLFLKWLKQQQRQRLNQQSVQLALRLKTDQRLLGFISLNEINHYHRSTEVGFWLGKPFWKQGYMSEALCKLTEYAILQLKLQRIEALLLQNNQACATTLSRCGFELEGVFKNKIRFQEKWQNIACYARISHDE